jgi:plasmid stabilization system protein ParE
MRGSIQATITRLVHMPMLGKLIDEPGVHVLVEPEYLYRVFYRIDGKLVTVISILHGSQM